MFVHEGAEPAMNTFRGRKGVTLCPGSGEDWYIFDHKQGRWFYFPHLLAQTGSTYVFVVMKCFIAT